MAEILCPSCNKRLRVNPQSKSRRMRCPVCQSEMALSVSGETVTAKLLSTTSLPAPPPVPPPPPPAYMPATEPAMEEPQVESYVEPAQQDVEPATQLPEPNQPEQPVIQLSTARSSARSSTSAERNTLGKNASSKDNNSALWIGGGIGLASVAILGIVGFLLMGGFFGGSGKPVAQATKTGEGKKKAAVVKEKDLPEVVAPTIDRTKEKIRPAAVPAEPVMLDKTPPPPEFTQPAETTPDVPPVPETPVPMPETPAPEKPAPEKPAAEKPETPEEPAKAPTKEKTKPAKTTPKTGSKKGDTKKPAAKGPPPATADCEVCRGQGLVPLKNPQPYFWMEGQPAPKGANAVREQFCPNCKPDGDNAQLAAAEDLRLKTAMDVHLNWEKKTNWQLVRAETRRATLHSQLPPADTQRVALALEAMTSHLEGLTGSVELTATNPANCNVIILFQKPNYTQFVNLLKVDPVFGPSRQDWSLVGEVAGSWVKDSIFYRYSPEGPPPDHQAIALVSSYQIRSATGYKDPAWLNVGYASYCENATLHANRVNSIEYALNNLQIDADWSLAVRRLAAAGGLKPWNDMFPKILRDYQAEDHLTAYAMVSFLIQYKPRKFLDFVKEIKGGLGAAEALEKSYGEKVPELQQRWVKALGGR
ncbi:MAG: hypothetical protein ACKVP0_02995 [Pirellulaceae bacterium]